VPASYAQHTLLAPYNSTVAVQRLFAQWGTEIAAVIVEPAAGNMGVVPPAPGFLQYLRDITRRAGSLLIFDEVITGFRVGFGGAQALFDVRPDLTCLGKIIGGGLPVGAYGGRRDIMEMVAPLGPVYQAGTLSGNPLSMAAGIATLRILKGAGVYDELETLGSALAEGLEDAARRAEVGLRINRLGSMMTPFFTAHPVNDYDSAKRSDTGRFAHFHREMLARGVYLPPSQFEALFVSLSHTRADLEATIAAAEEAFRALS